MSEPSLDPSYLLKALRSFLAVATEPVAGLEAEQAAPKRDAGGQPTVGFQGDLQARLCSLGIVGAAQSTSPLVAAPKPPPRHRPTSACTLPSCPPPASQNLLSLRPPRPSQMVAKRWGGRRQVAWCGMQRRCLTMPHSSSSTTCPLRCRLFSQPRRRGSSGGHWRLGWVS